MQKRKVYKKLVTKPSLCDLETTALIKRREEKTRQGAELMISLGLTRMGWIKNKNIRGTARIRRPKDEVKEAGLRWFGHTKWRNSEYC